MRRLKAKALRRKTGGERDMIDTLAIRQPHSARDRIGRQPAIGIREKNPIAPGEAGSHVAGVALAEPAIWQFVDPNDSHSRILLGETSENGIGLIRRAVVR